MKNALFSGISSTQKDSDSDDDDFIGPPIPDDVKNPKPPKEESKVLI